MHLLVRSAVSVFFANLAEASLSGVQACWLTRWCLVGSLDFSARCLIVCGVLALSARALLGTFSRHGAVTPADQRRIDTAGKQIDSQGCGVPVTYYAGNTVVHQGLVHHAAGSQNGCTIVLLLLLLLFFLVGVRSRNFGPTKDTVVYLT